MSDEQSKQTLPPGLASGLKWFVPTSAADAAQEPDESADQKSGKSLDYGKAENAIEDDTAATDKATTTAIPVETATSKDAVTDETGAGDAAAGDAASEDAVAVAAISETATSEVVISEVVISEAAISEAAISETAISEAAISEVDITRDAAVEEAAGDAARGPDGIESLPQGATDQGTPIGTESAVIQQADRAALTADVTSDATDDQIETAAPVVGEEKAPDATATATAAAAAATNPTVDNNAASGSGDQTSYEDVPTRAIPEDATVPGPALYLHKMPPQAPRVGPMNPTVLPPAALSPAALSPAAHPPAALPPAALPPAVLQPAAPISAPLRRAQTAPPSGPPTAGWFGKIPALGDFITRRLPTSFTAPWDDWLGHGMIVARRQLDDQFEHLYLTFPIWHFLLPAGQFGPQAWCGVLSPSVDRVGRLFPLTIAEPVAADAIAGLSLDALQSHLQVLADVALLALDEAPPDALDRRLADALASSAALTAPATSAAASAAGGGAAALSPLVFARHDSPARWSLTGSMRESLHQASEAWLLDNARQRAIWWTPAGSGQPGSARLETLPLRDDLLSDLISA